MRTYQSLMKGTKFGAVIKPGDSFTSILIQLVEGRAHASIKMPFGMNGGLAEDKIGILKKWVNQGAKNNWELAIKARRKIVCPQNYLK